MTIDQFSDPDPSRSPSNLIQATLGAGAFAWGPVFRSGLRWHRVARRESLDGVPGRPQPTRVGQRPADSGLELARRGSKPPPELDTLTFESSSPQGKGRYTYRFEGDDGYHFRLENSFDGGKTYSLMMEGTYRRKK